MSKNRDQFILGGRKPCFTCKLQSVSRSGPETKPGPNEGESEHDGKLPHM